MNGVEVGVNKETVRFRNNILFKFQDYVLGEINALYGIGAGVTPSM